MIENGQNKFTSKNWVFRCCEVCYDFRTLDSCRFCFANGKMRDAICAEGDTVYLAVTGNEPMTEGHCMIITKNHYASLPCCDEDVAAEILNWRRKLSSMWKLDDKVNTIY